MSAEIIDGKYIRVYVTLSKSGYIGATDFRPTYSLNNDEYRNYYYDIPLPDGFAIQKADAKDVKPIFMG